MTTADSNRPLSGKVALVTGASHHIGGTIAAAMADAGAHAVLASKDSAGLSDLVATITSAGGAASAMSVDMGNEDSVRALLVQIRDRFGRLDAAVNYVGAGRRAPIPLAEWASEEFDIAISEDLRGVFLCMKYEIELMRSGGTGGAIVNMCSPVGEQGFPGMSGNVASDFGVTGLTRAAAYDYASEGIRVNAISREPASIPGEIADGAVWLCSDQSLCLTGTILTVGRSSHPTEAERATKRGPSLLLRHRRIPGNIS